MNRLDSTFAELKTARRAALMPYLPLGYPTMAVSRELIRAASDAGADILELGVPFSDPLADGPVIQRATEIALANGMTLARCLEMVAEARGAGVTIPLVLMGYANPLFRYGLERFAANACAAGADGVIVPDLPVEESGALAAACDRSGLALVLLAAPTSSPERLKAIGAATRGFLYLVSLAGVTGERGNLAEGLPDLIAHARAATTRPVCVGFGISSAANAHHVAELADGVIVGSALVAKIGDPETAVRQASAFVSELRQAVSRGS